MPRPFSRTAAFVDQAPKYGEKIRNLLDLVQDHQPVPKARKVKLRVGKFRQIRRALQILIVPRLTGIQRSGQSGFPRLTRSHNPTSTTADTRWSR